MNLNTEQRAALRLLRFMLTENRLYVAWTPDIRLGHGAMDNVDPLGIWGGTYFVRIGHDGQFVYEYMFELEEFDQSEVDDPLFFALWPKSAHEKLALIARINGILGEAA